MSFYKKTSLSKLFYPIIILSLLIVSCSTDNSITDSSDQTSLSKPNGTNDISSTDPLQDIKNIIVFFYGPDAWNNCVLTAGLFAPYAIPYLPPTIPNNNKYSEDKYAEELFNKSYDFRDNFLFNTDKGKSYIYYYYKLSEYSIANNIIGEYYKEHMQITPICINIAHDLQHGTNPNKILFTERTYNDLIDIMKIYRDSESHKDIDVVLDYLETDLEKYYSKTQTEITADFGF